MSEYGFTMSVKDLTSAQMKQIENAIKSVGGTVRTQTQNMEDDFGKLGESVNQFKRNLFEAFAIREVYNFGKELLNVAAEFQGFSNVIKYSSDGIVDTSQNMNYLNDAIVRMHLPMKETYEAFSEMQAGFYGTGIEGEKLRKVFEGVSEASTVLHLTPEKFSRVTFALKEIGELGTLQARQMRMLAFSLPGAMNLAAKSMGMNTEQFHKAMKGGQIQSSVFLPKFSEALTQHFHSGLANAGNSLLAQINDEKNSILKLMLDMGTTLEPLFLDILHTVSHAMQDIKSVWNSLSGNPGFINALKNIFDWAVKIVPIWIAYEIVIKAITISTDLLISAKETMIGVLETETAATEGATAAWASFNAIIETSVIGGAVVTLGLMVEHFISMNKQIDEIIDKKYKLSQNSGFLNSQSNIAYQIQEKYNSAIQTKDTSARKDLLQDVANQIAQMNKMSKDSIPMVKYRDSILQGDAKVVRPRSKTDRFFNGVGFPALWTNDPAKKIIDSAATSTSKIASYGNLVESMNKLQGTIATKFKIKPTQSDYQNPGKTDGASAITTSNLSGASGGLGQAKQIFIHIDTLQKNEGVKESKNQADQAVEKITELLNSYSDSQNSQ